MGSQPQAQAPQQAHARPMANHASSQQNNTSNGNGNGPLTGGTGGGSISRIPSLARQTSIYSVTLDELQKSVMNQEPGQTFGSMNMDEFLKNIWTMEESQAMAQAMSIAPEGGGGRDEQGGGSNDTIPPENGGVSLIRQPSLVKQPSLALPRTLSRKTVDEVWRDIVKTNPNLAPSEDGAGDVDNTGPGVSASDARRQTYGEMTLEAFLVKAGVVKDGGLLAQPSTPYNLFSPYATGGSNGTSGPSDRGNERERMGPGSLAATLSLSPANGLGSQTEIDAYKQQGQAQAQAQQQAAQQQAAAQQQGQIDWLRNIQQQQAHQQAHQQQQQQLYHHQQQAQADVYAMQRKAANGGMLPNMGQNGGYTGIASALAPGLGPMGMAQLGGGMALGLAPNSPAHSPASDGVGHSHGNGLSLSPVGNYGVDGGLRGRKRGADGPVEKVVERRQRRMIKNRESAARSRARKQAYTVELEAEVTQLKEENSKLRKAQEEAATLNKKLVLDNIMNVEVGGKRLRRTRTGPW